MTFSKLGTDIQTGQIVELPQASRRQGLYIIGANGTGKTGLIENLILQDIDQGLGVGLLDPHGDLTNAILAKMTKRLDDVILLDITDKDYPFGLNLFECPDPTDSVEVQKIVDQVMHIFEKLYDVSRQTPRMAQFLRNCTYTLIANPGHTMAEIPLLLQDDQCRKKLVAQVTDLQVLLFWKTYDALKSSEQQDRAESTLNKMDEFLQPLTRNIVGQAITTMNMFQVMDERKILLVKLSAQLDQVTSLIGSVIIAQLLNAAYSRANMPVTKRKQFNIYADEFQRFATEDFATLLTEARKFGIATTIAHQARYQPGMTDGIRAVSLQAANFVVFRITSPDAEELKGAFHIKQEPGQPIFEYDMEPVYDYWQDAEWDSPEAQAEYKTLTQEFARLSIQLDALEYFRLKHYESKFGAPPTYKTVPEIWNYTYHTLKQITPTSPHWQELVKEYSWWLQPNYQVCDEVGEYIIRTFYVPKLFKRQGKDYEDKQLVIHPHIREGVAYYLPPELPSFFERYAELTGNPFGHNPYHPMTCLPNEANHVVNDNVRNRDVARQDHIVAATILQATRDAFLKEVRKVFLPIKSRSPWYFDALGYQKHSDGFGQFLVDGHGNYYKYEAGRLYSSLSEYTYHWKMPLYPEMALWIRNKILELVPQREEIDRKRTKLWNEHNKIVPKKQFLYYRPKTAWQQHSSWIRGKDYVDAPTYRMKDGPLRPIADMQNELAVTLANLPLYTARVKVAANNGTVEHTIKTLAPGQGIGKTALDQRIADIQARNRDPRYGGYCRPRKDVEAEIIQRQTGCSGSPAAQPQSPQQLPHARQVPTCPNCGASNKPGSKFCNQCGTKL